MPSWRPSCWRRAARFAETLPEEYRDYIEFYDPQRYNAAATVQDNMLFGRLIYGQAQAAQRIYRLLFEVVSELGLKAEVLAVGLDHGVGTGGRRLTAAAAAEGGAGARPGAPAADPHPQQRAGAAGGRRADPHPQGAAERNEGPLL